MVEFDKSSTVGEIVAARPSLSRVMDRHGISYCCGGGKSLESACAQKGVDVDTVLAEIGKAMAAPPEKNLTALSLERDLARGVSPAGSRGHRARRSPSGTCRGAGRL